mgnify:CR=1 FL=1
MNIRQKCKKLKNENRRLRKIANVSYGTNYDYLRSHPITLILTDKINPEELEFYKSRINEKELVERFSEMIGPNIDTIYYPDIFTGAIIAEHRLTVFKHDINGENEKFIRYLSEARRGD